MAAILLGTDLIVHEQNSVMSRTNRFLGRYATVVASSFKNQICPGVHQNRPDRHAGPQNHQRALYRSLPQGRQNAAVPYPWFLGGSQGAKIFSKLFRKPSKP